ncbi:hypothetical protein LINPERPRIM_LOCUS24754, partial [Linum perenne]
FIPPLPSSLSLSHFLSSLSSLSFFIFFPISETNKTLKIFETHPHSYVVAGVDPHVVVAIAEPSEPSRKKGVTLPPLLQPLPSDRDRRRRRVSVRSPPTLFLMVLPPPLSFRLLSITWPSSPYFVSRRRLVDLQGV